MPIIQNGQGLEIAVPPGQSIAVASLTGTYSATLLDGAGRGVLASASAGGATYGPYPAGATLRVKAGVDSCVAYDVGASPVASGQYPARFATNAEGDISGLSDNDGGLIPLIDMALSTDIGRAAINAEKINAALSKRGHVAIAGGQGTIYVSQSLRIYSNTRLTVGQGTTIKRAGGMEAPILINDALLRHIADQRATVTVTWTKGTEAVINWPGHGLGRHDYVWLTGATGTSGALFNNVFRVMRVASVDTLQVQLPEVPKATPTGTIRALACDVGVKVEGGAWDGNYEANPQATVTYNRDNWALIGLGRSRFSDYQHFDFHRGVTSGALGDVVFKEADYGSNETAASEAHKTFGPVNGLLLASLNANASDDGMSMQVKEAPAFAWAGMPEGDIRGVKVTKCRAQSANLSAAGAFALYCANGYKFAGITYEDCDGHSNNGAGLGVAFGDTFNSGRVDDLSVIRCNTTTANDAQQFALNIGCPVGLLTLDTDKTKQSSGAATVVLVQGAAFIDVLKVRGLYFNDASWPATVTHLWRIAGEVTNLEFEDARITGNPSTFEFMAVTGTVANLTFSNSNIDNVQRLVKTSGTGVVRALNLIGSHAASCPSLFELTNTGQPTKVTLTSNTLHDIGGGVVRGTTNAGLVAEVYGAGNTWTGGSVPINTANSALVGVYSEDLAIDPIALAASLPTTAGQRCRSTRTGATNQGPAVRVAAGWVAIGTGASGANTAIT